MNSDLNFSINNLKNFIGGNPIIDDIEGKMSDSTSNDIKRIVKLSEKFNKENSDKPVSPNSDNPVSPEMITGSLPIPQKLVSPNSPDKESNEPLKNIIELVRPSNLNTAFDRKTMHKIIDGKSYKTFDEFQGNPIRCFFETCKLTWEMTPWQKR